MLPANLIEVESTPDGLEVEGRAIRQSGIPDEADPGLRFEAVLKNETPLDLIDLEYALRYYGSEGEFLGLDQGFALGAGSDQIRQGHDKSISFDLTVPPAAAKAVFVVNARHNTFFEKYQFAIVAGMLLVMALLYVLIELVRS